MFDMPQRYSKTFRVHSTMLSKTFAYVECRRSDNFNWILFCASRNLFTDALISFFFFCRCVQVTSKISALIKAKCTSACLHAAVRYCARRGRCVITGQEDVLNVGHANYVVVRHEWKLLRALCTYLQTLDWDVPYVYTMVAQLWHVGL